MKSALPAAVRLGTFVAGHDWAGIQPALRHEALRSLVNYFGCGIRVANEPAIAALVRVLAGLSARHDASILGRAERLDIGSAAFVNAAAANFLDFDDTHLPTVIHPTAPVAAAVLALAQSRGASGRDALHAFILGAEVACRAGNMVSPGHYARGWHITATCGALGAAGGCARLLGLDAAGVAHAVGIAAGMSSGLVENLSWPAKNIGVGNAARGGVLAALMAGEGYTAAPTSLDGPLGWARAMGDEPQVEAGFEGLGSHWEFARNTYKPYPAGIVFHAVIDACFELHSRHGLAASTIRSVTVAGDALLLARGDRAVHNERDARVSIHHSAAAVFVLGAAGLHEFSPAAAMAPAVVEFRRRVTAELDDTMPSGAARVTLETDDGRTFSHTVLAARGSESRPMADHEIEAKAVALISDSCTGVDARGLLALAWQLDEAETVAPLMQAASRTRVRDRTEPATATQDIA